VALRAPVRAVGPAERRRAFALSKDDPMRQVSLGLELIGIKC
jgi:hypothetical protein